MRAEEFSQWRQGVGITQERAAEILKVTRTTIQNWEGGVTQIPPSVDASCQIWGHRLRQINPDTGPVTLIYSNGSMFLNPYGPRRAPAMMQQESYPTVVGALARVQQLWGGQDFCNPFIIDEALESLWNIVQLERAVDGKDEGAPILTNLLRITAKEVRANAHMFARRGPRMLTPTEREEHEQAIKQQADELDRLAETGLGAILQNRQQIDSVFSNLRSLGTKAPDNLVSAIAQAFVIFERGPKPAEMGPRLEQGGYVLDYRGCVIMWPERRLFGGKWTVNVASNDRRLLGKLGGCLVIEDFQSLEGAIAKARRRIDDLI